MQRVAALEDDPILLDLGNYPASHLLTNRVNIRFPFVAQDGPALMVAQYRTDKRWKRRGGRRGRTCALRPHRHRRRLLERILFQQAVELREGWSSRLAIGERLRLLQWLRDG